MNTRFSSQDKVRKMAMLAMLSAVIIVLQAISSFFRIGNFTINLALTPIIIGAAIYGWKAGAFLGTVLGAYIFCSGLWIDGSMIAMVQYNFWASIVLCILKTAAAGALAGLVYHLAVAKSPFGASLLASITAPIVNTGIFAVGMMTILNGFLGEVAIANGSANPISFLFLIMIGLNFMVEFIVNTALATAITRILDYYNRKYGRKAAN